MKMKCKRCGMEWNWNEKILPHSTNEEHRRSYGHYPEVD